MTATPLRKALLTALGALVAVLFVAPYVQMLITALTPDSELYSIPARYLPSRLEFSNLVDVWVEAPLWDYLVSSLVIAGFATLLALAVALPAAYYTARYRYRGRTLFMLLVLVTQMFAPTALVIGIYREFVSIRDIVPAAGVDTYVSLILVNAAFNLAFSTWIMVAYFSTIPVELEEAAAIDGATRLGVLRRVTLPLALPGIVTATIFTFIAAWNEFVVALTLAQSPRIKPLTVGVTVFIGQYRVEWQYLFASAVIAIVPVVVLFIVIERWLVSGLTAGGVK
jgi:multiple sugar transport system permease protein